MLRDNIDIEATRVYSIEDARAFLSARSLDVDALAREVTLIFTFGPISGAHFNPAVTLGDASQMGFEDPAAFQGTEQERLDLFRRVRDEIRDYLKTFPS